MDKNEILRKIEEEGVEFIYLQFTDIFGIMKNVAITVNELERALNNEIVFDGSSIDGFVRIEESDMYLYPDLKTFLVYPWYSSFGREARFICDIYDSEGKPFEGDPRYILKKVLKEAEDMGYQIKIGPECEFFLFNTDEFGKPTLVTHDDASYFDLAPVDLGENARREMVLNLNKMGYDVEASHHEVAPGQHEIDLKNDYALNAADKIVTFKQVVRKIAKNHGLHATFMPKPIYGIAGSGLHTNIFVYKDGKNAFYDNDDKYNLSKEAYGFIAGLMEHAKAISAITNPNINSYKRLVSGYEAPIYISWSCKNRSPLIRVPSRLDKNARIELRSPDPSCNPYLSLAVIIKAGLDGIKRNLTPCEPIDKNLYEITIEERLEVGIETLPQSLREALSELKKDDLIKEALGQHVYNRFIEAKKLEWQEYKSVVTSWEVERYLTKY